MAGILNKKERIMDVIVTREGRRQIADGNLRATFASFTDNMSFYEYDPVSGSTDPTDRIYFEAFSTEADQIIYENDDSGRLIGEINQPDLTIFGDQIFKKNSQGEYLELSGSVFASEIKSIVTASIFNFRSQQILGSEKGNKLNSKQFDLTLNKVYFEINNFSPFGENPNNKIIDLQSSTPLMFDRRLANFPYFKFLPPVKTNGRKVAQFTNVQTPNKFNYQNIIRNNSSIEDFVKDVCIPQSNNENALNNSINKEGTPENLVDAVETINTTGNFVDPLQKRTIEFLETSDNNNLFCQMFEVNAHGKSRRLTKLDILDMGQLSMTDKELEMLEFKYKISQRNNQNKRFFYVGKVFEDEFGVPTFIRLFTLMFD